MKVGYTGTRAGMTDAQLHSFIELVHGMMPVAEFHHGDCVGGDAEALEVVRNITQATVVSHPATISAYRAFTHADDERPRKPFLERNHDIVHETDVMVATPKETRELRRGSGTWAAIRYARRQGKPLVIIWPDGQTGA